MSISDLPEGYRPSHFRLWQKWLDLDQPLRRSLSQRQVYLDYRQWVRSPDKAKWRAKLRGRVVYKAFVIPGSDPLGNMKLLMARYQSLSFLDRVRAQKERKIGLICEYSITNCGCECSKPAGQLTSSLATL